VGFIRFPNPPFAVNLGKTMHDDIEQILRSQIRESQQPTTEADILRSHLQQYQQAIIHLEVVVRTQRLAIDRLREENEALKVAIAAFQDNERDLSGEIMVLRVVVGVLAIGLLLAIFF
jgi:chromosome segregation ATPase